MLKKMIRRAGKSRPATQVLSAGAKLITRRPSAEVEGDGEIEARFRGWLRGLTAPRVIEIGTRRTANAPSTIRRDWAGADATYICTDFMAGQDVDVVADAERLSETFAPGSVDAVIACSAFEHIRKPWLAAAEIGKVLRPGGKAFVQTHHTFPLHAYPYDYWRFSREALESLFEAEHGFVERASFYRYPVAIVSERAPLAFRGRAYLNVCVLAEKAGQSAT
jgi:SAM-dependent methyltransferase